MSVPTIFFMFLNAFAPLVLNPNHITTLVFDEPVGVWHTALSKKELYIKKSPDGKMLFISPTGININSKSLTVPTKSGKLYSFLLKEGPRPNSIVRIKDGKRGKSYRDIQNLRGVIIQESKMVARVHNTRKQSVVINTMILPSGSKLEIPKGSPLFINGERVYR